MSSLSVRSIRWLARVLAARSPAPRDVMPGVDAALDGATALAVAESSWCDLACLGATFPASVAARAWSKRPDAINALGARVHTLDASSAPGALAAAIGAASAGLRATAFLSGQDLDRCHDLLRKAAGRRVPLVMHVATRGAGGGAIAFGGGHDTWHGAADCGWIQLFAANAHEAVDLALVARLAAERSLVPVMVAVDGPETALAAQDVRLPEPALVRELLARPDARHTPPTPAQRLTFGEHRDAVPRWHDLDEPAALGAVEPPELAPLNAAGGEWFFGAHAGEALAAAFELVAKRTGRPLGAIEAHDTVNAEVVLIATGVAGEYASVAAARLRHQSKAKVGVVNIRQHRPFPGAAIAEAAKHAKTVIVLERATAGLGAHPPLTRDVRDALSERVGRIGTLIHGIGTHAAPPHAIAEGCRRLLAGGADTIHVGVTVDPTPTTSPKRRAVLDAVRRDYPNLGAHALAIAAPDEPDHADLTVAIRRTSAADESSAAQAAAVLHAVGGSRLRTLPSLTPAGHDRAATDLLAFGPGACRPSSEFADITVCTSDAPIAIDAFSSDAGRARTLLIPLDADGMAPACLTRDVVATLHAQRVDIVGVPVPASRAYEPTALAWRRHEAILGALTAFAAPRLSTRQLSAERAAAARATFLDDLAEPERDAHLDAFRHGFEHHAPVTDAVLRPARNEAAPEPSTAPHPTFTGHPINSPAEHWARVGLLAAAGRAGEIAADPFAPCAVTPAGSTARRSLAGEGDELLEFDPGSCDGSAAPWVFCPDGSVVAVALGAKALLETAVHLAGAAGRAADALLLVVPKLAPFVHKHALAEQRPPATLRDACEPAFDAFLGKLAPPDDRRAALQAAFAAAMDALGMLPIARTNALFDSLEAAKPGTGAFLILGVNPDATRDARAATPEALGHGVRLAERTPARLERARTLWRLFESLPDTPGEIIAHATDHPAIGPLGAAMLARTCSTALAPADDYEPGSGERLALRLALAGAEAQVQPGVQRFVGEIRALRERLAQRVHETMASALPDTDLDALAAGLHAMGRDDVELGELSKRVANAVEGARLDTPALTRLVDTARVLADLEWRLTKGPTGLGRARLGAAVACSPGTLSAITAPFNPFAIPVSVDAGPFAPEFARGLAKAQTQAALDAVRALRRAKIELERPTDAAHQLERLAALRPQDLTPEERAIIPPLLLVGDDDALTGAALGSVLWLLSGDVPVKILLLTGAGGRADAGSAVDAFGSYPPAPHADVALLAALGRHAYVAQTSIALPDHLGAAVRGAMDHDGPALVRVHAPSPARHGFAPTRTIEQARLAVTSRTHPIFTFDPHADGIFGLCLDLAGNPAPDQTWASGSNPVTPADWAITEARFRERFTPLPPSAQATPIARTLVTPASERGVEPAKVIDPLDKSPWIPSPELLAFADARVRSWRTLQELAGVVTPFTERVRTEAERSVAAEREHDMAELERRHASELAEIRAGMQADSLARVREGLLALAGYAPAPEDAEA